MGGWLVDSIISSVPYDTRYLLGKSSLYALKLLIVLREKKIKVAIYKIKWLN